MPEPMRTSTRPSTSSAISASRTDGRETPSCSARSRSGGKRVPTAYSPRSTRPRSCWLGSVIAIVCLALLGGLAWYLTHQTKSGAVAAPGGPGGPGGPGPGGPGGGGGGRGAPPSTVGVAVARKADIPVVIEALG